MPRHFCVQLDLVICSNPVPPTEHSTPQLGAVPSVDLGHSGSDCGLALPTATSPPTQATLGPRGITLEGEIVRL